MLPSKVDNDTWKQKILKKYNERVAIYRENSYKIEHLDEMISFIDNNLELLNNRKLTFLHGDYQGRNIVVNQACAVGVIDFERTSFGDPYEEFNRMVTYTRKWSVPFCNGQIHGYFDGEKIPKDFWKVNAFHTAINLTTTLIYALMSSKEYIFNENNEAKELIYRDLKEFTCFIPSWYIDKDC